MKKHYIASCLAILVLAVFFLFVFLIMYEVGYYLLYEKVW